MANSKTAKKNEKVLPADWELDEEMPDSDDDLEVEDDGAQDEPEDEEVDEVTSDEEEAPEDDEMPDVVVTQPTSASEPVTLENASALMDLIEPDGETGLTIFESLRLQGKQIFWRKRPVAAIRKQEDGLFTVWKLRSSIPGKVWDDVDGAEQFEVSDKPSSLPFAISWLPTKPGCFSAKVLAFAGQSELGFDFEISTEIDGQTSAMVKTDREIVMDAEELATYASAASWASKVAAWFEDTHSSTGDADDDE